MPDPVVPEGSSVTSTVTNAAQSTGKFIANTARATIESVKNDGTTLVGRNVGVGARVEAGLNLAADAASFVTGPEDAAIERGAVFALKEGIEHAPQVAEGAALLGKAAAREAPEIAKGATAIFDQTKSLLERGGHEIIGSSAERGVIETKHAIYSIAEGAEANFGRIGQLLGKAIEDKKNFAVHGPHLSDEAASVIKTSRHDLIGELEGIKTSLTRDQSFEKVIGDLEKSHSLKHGLHKVQEIGKSITEPIETGKKLLETGKVVVENVGKIGIVAGAAEYAEQHAGHFAHEAVNVVGSAANHVEKDVSRIAAGVKQVVQHAASDAPHEAGHLISEAGKGVDASAKLVEKAVGGVVDDVKHWTPGMPFEKFAGLMNRIRGGPAAPTHDIPHRTPSQHHGVDR